MDSTDDVINDDRLVPLLASTKFKSSLSVSSDQTESHLSPRKSTGMGCSDRSKFNVCCIGPPGLAGCPSLPGKHPGRVKIESWLSDLN
ncbi:Uncharacterised protein [Vibrio cholerae]|uniref:Uncharacterized protein n=1 Tax=Vibrio cholerae TaxID=666 RepID=A0A656AWK5_VIBCL|nr:Uncharacterised protein [Vibrio cholerae]